MKTSFYLLLNIVIGIFSLVTTQYCSHQGKVTIFSDQPRGVSDRSGGNIDSRQVAPGGQLILLCCTPTDSIIQPRLKWIGPGDQIVGPLSGVEQKVFSFPDQEPGRAQMILVIKDMAESDVGNYKCINEDLENSQPAVVQVQLRQKLSLIAASDQWLEGGLSQPQLVACQIEQPQANVRISWFRETQRLKEGRYEITESGLLISNVTLQDAGSYVCSARIPGVPSLMAVHTIRVRVFQAPKVTVGPVIQPQRLNQGLIYRAGIENQTMNLFCLVSGSPSPQVHWTFGNKSVGESTLSTDCTVEAVEKYITWQVADKSSSQLSRAYLRVCKFQASDRGVYTCTAELQVPGGNKVVRDQKELNIKFLVSPKVIQPELMNSVPSNMGGSTQISCNVLRSGDFFMALTKLLPNGDRQVLGNGRGKYSRFNIETKVNDEVMTQTLTVTDLQPSDNGVYFCFSENELAKVEVKGRITVYYPPNQVELVKADSFAWAGHTSKIVCRTTCEPQPTWRWLLNGVPLNFTTNEDDVKSSYDMKISKNESSSTFESTLSITPKNIRSPVFGLYVCEATNNIVKGSLPVSQSTVLREATRPGVPNVTIEEPSPTSTIFRMHPPVDNGGAELTGYEIMYQVNGGAEYGPYEFALKDRIRIKNMNPETSYRFFISAKNRVGAGPRYLVKYDTGPLAPPEKLRIISDFLSKDPKSYFLRWKVFSNGGFPIHSYRIRIRTVHISKSVDGRQKIEPMSEWREYNPYVKAESSKDEDLNDLESSRQFEIDHLDPDTTYEVRIQARTVLGLSDESEQHIFRTQYSPNDQVHVAAALKKASTALGSTASVVYGGVLAPIFVWMSAYRWKLRC